MQLQERLVKSLPGSEIRLNLLMDPQLSIAELADEVLKTARGEDDDCLFAPIVPIPMVFPDGDDKCAHTELPQWVVDSAQVVGILVVVVLVAANLIPAYRYGLALQWERKKIGGRRILVRRSNPPWTHITISKGRDIRIYGILVPIVIPVFMLSLTIVTIVAKWLIVGRYRAVSITRRSVSFLRWWVMDRLMDQWDRFVGVFIADTMLLSVVYSLMGCRIALLGTRIETLLREFDLITIGRGATVSGSVFARMFTPGGWLTFAPVCLGTRSTMRWGSVVMPGTVVDEGVLLDYNGATMAGMHLNENTRYEGSPAQDAGPRSASVAVSSDVFLEGLKPALLGPLLYIPFLGTNLISATILELVNFLDWRFRYRELMYWMLGFLLSTIVAAGLVVALKRVFVGNGIPRLKNLVSCSVAWMIEFMWYRVVCNFGTIVFGENGAWTTLLWRACGVKMPLNVLNINLSIINPVEASLISIGAFSVTGAGKISAKTSSGEYNPTRLERRVQVGLRGCVRGGCVLESGSVLAHMTVLNDKDVLVSNTIRYGNNSHPVTLTMSSKSKVEMNELRQHRAILTAYAFAMCCMAVTTVLHFTTGSITTVLIHFSQSKCR